MPPARLRPHLVARLRAPGRHAARPRRRHLHGLRLLPRQTRGLHHRGGVQAHPHPPEHHGARHVARHHGQPRAGRGRQQEGAPEARRQPLRPSPARTRQLRLHQRALPREDRHHPRRVQSDLQDLHPRRLRHRHALPRRRTRRPLHRRRRRAQGPQRPEHRQGQAERAAHQLRPVDQDRADQPQRRLDAQRHLRACAEHRQPAEVRPVLLLLRRRRAVRHAEHQHRLQEPAERAQSHHRAQALRALHGRLARGAVPPHANPAQGRQARPRRRHVHRHVRARLRRGRPRGRQGRHPRGRRRDRQGCTRGLRAVHCRTQDRPARRLSRRAHAAAQEPGRAVRHHLPRRRQGKLDPVLRAEPRRPARQRRRHPR
mmetsp:Transcript_43130/g.36185  ORF Transcript_43130/g.36185 Transcript_43130/m.36185 type:complete len:371 (+) Transcript_43130:1321-2433(+)